MTATLTLRMNDHASARAGMARLAKRAVFAWLMLLALLAGTVGARAGELKERFAAHDAGSTFKVDHSPWDRLLKTYLRMGEGETALNRVDYGALKARGMTQLNEYLADLQSVDVARLSRPEQFAFWTNLYNASTVAIVAGKYPVRSIRDIRPGNALVPGPWKKKLVTVSGVKLSLDDIEHGILRPIWRDARIHYAVNCAAYTCPNLSARAYTGDSLETMLDNAARAYINSPRAIRFSGSRVIASSLYDWYAGDFGGSVQNIVAHLREYAAPALAKRFSDITKFDGYDYNWILNDAQ